MRVASFLSRVAISLSPLVVLLSSSPARGEEGEEKEAATEAPTASAPASPPPASAALETPAPREMRMNWYGWQTLLVDAAAWASLYNESKSRTFITLGTYALGPPIVHLLHGRPGVALADFGLRVGAPVVLGAIGMGFGAVEDARCHAQLCVSVVAGLFAGIFVGYVWAVLADAAALSNEQVPVEPKATAIRWAPMLGAQKSGGQVGVVGSF